MRLKSQVGNLENHSSPGQIRNLIGEETFSSFRKIACIRNAFSLMVSGHFFAAQAKGLDKKDVDNEKAFTAFVLEKFSEKNWQEDLPDLVDSSWKLIRQEHLESDVRHVASDLGLEIGRTLHLKSGLRPTGKMSCEYLYSMSTKDLVAARYRKWLDAFDYSFS